MARPGTGQGPTSIPPTRATPELSMKVAAVAPNQELRAGNVGAQYKAFSQVPSNLVAALSPETNRQVMGLAPVIAGTQSNP